MSVLFVAACAPPPGVPGTTETGSYQPSYDTPASHIQTADSPLPPAPSIDPGILLGLRSDEVEDLLGTAALERREPRAQVWQYAHADCVLHVFLYEKEGTYLVEYYEARSANSTADVRATCVAGLIKGRDIPAKP